MSSMLKPFLNSVISIITNDGRHIVGHLRGFDQQTNLIVENCHERVYSLESGVEMAPLGLYVVRGDNVALVGDVDEELDQKLDLSAIRAKGLGPIQW
jgi:U6 snRNA-associated Sm-like protein LSm8